MRCLVINDGLKLYGVRTQKEGKGPSVTVRYDTKMDKWVDSWVEFEFVPCERSCIWSYNDGLKLYEEKWEGGKNPRLPSITVRYKNG